MNADKTITPEIYAGDYFRRHCKHGCAVLELVSADHTNKLRKGAVAALLEYVGKLQDEADCADIKALIITGN